MWNALKQFVTRMNEEGRAKFDRLASDDERSSAVIVNALLMAGLGAALLTALYFVLFLTLVLIYLRDSIGEPTLWYFLMYISAVLGSIQGCAAGIMVGWGQAEYWQGKRNTAGTILALGGAILIALMALFEVQFYSPEIPAGDFLFWAVLLFSPGYLAATTLIAWGLALLSVEK